MTQAMDRRSFIGLGALGALAAGAGLAGCAPQSSGAPAATDTLSETGEEAPAGIPRKEGDETKECDVAVVGAGAAGLMAALNLARGGKKVVVIEVGPSAAISNFAMCGGPTACETKLQAQENATVTLDQIFTYMNDFSRGSVNSALLRNCLAHTGEAIDTMLDLGIGMDLIPDTYGVGFRGRHMFQAGGEDRVGPLVADIEANGGEFLFNTKAEKIIMEDGAVAGVQTDAGIDVMAPAVVVCTGGFGGNEDMQLEKLNTTVFPLGSTLSDGTGINMVLDAGGAWDRNFAVLGNECGAVSKATVSPFTEDWHNTNEHLGYWLFGGLYTDPVGERFISEGKIAQFPLAVGGEALLRAGKAYIIMDDDYYQAVQGDGIFAYLGQPAAWISGPVADYYKTTPENAEAHLQEAIEQGWAVKADSIAEIAEAFDLPALEKTVENYNRFCETGVDEEYGKEAHFLKAVKTAPFYAFEYVPSCWSTNGGVKVDSHLRAVDADNKAIPGLYVAGVDQGSVYSVPYYTNEGSSVGLAIGSGAYVAAEILGA
ncbi:FAD-binding protein [Adlercreutzia sp. R25]|uniref:FAD-binding protein n=1 Tax=Adlercreutzia shanghongiae TaxID=3111773 RepID=A0ABU6IWW0_9ACTN|nr:MULTISPECIES: FAD-binding protein [unclassified Adlercreutzia]MEC4273664.1 FAD-binding protein [Adlercreutzia sp. R25]MEC4294097.1 FAD-binding protein [Adlercreutzia sp. R22]